MQKNRRIAIQPERPTSAAEGENGGANDFSSLLLRTLFQQK
jgi:hypothetical protein